MMRRSEIMSIISKRKTCRVFLNKKVPKKELRFLINATRYAPSAHNSQPWYFIVLTRESIGKRQVLKNIKSLMNHIPIGPKIFLKKSVEVMRDAPVLIFVLNKKNFVHLTRVYGSKYVKIARDSEFQSIAAAIQNLILVATSRNIGTAWLTSPLVFRNELTRTLKVEHELVAILALGYSSKASKRTRRASIEEICEFR